MSFCSCVTVSLYASKVFLAFLGHGVGVKEALGPPVLGRGVGVKEAPTPGYFATSVSVRSWCSFASRASRSLALTRASISSSFAAAPSSLCE